MGRGFGFGALRVGILTLVLIHVRSLHLLLLHLLLHHHEPIFEPPYLRGHLFSIRINLFPQRANSRINHCLLAIDFLLNNPVNALFYSSNLRFNFKPVIGYLCIYFLLNNRVHLQSALLRSKLKVALLLFDTLAELVSLLVHVGYYALEDCFLLE